MVIWLVGLSGSGKTTLGRELVRQWREVVPNVVLLDGDELRELFAHDRGSDPYSIEGRRLNAERMVSLCEMMDRQGIHVVCCILSIFSEMRQLNRTRFNRYFEVFMDAPLAAVQRRDVKGLYRAASEGKTANVVGIDIPFATPLSYDLRIDSSSDTPDVPKLARNVLPSSGAIK